MSTPTAGSKRALALSDAENWISKFFVRWQRALMGPISEQNASDRASDLRAAARELEAIAELIER